MTRLTSLTTAWMRGLSTGIRVFSSLIVSHALSTYSPDLRKCAIASFPPQPWLESCWSRALVLIYFGEPYTVFGSDWQVVGPVRVVFPVSWPHNL
jgi:hypothetical protein